MDADNHVSLIVHHPGVDAGTALLVMLFDRKQDLSLAYRMFEHRGQDVSQTMMLEARLLSGAPMEAIAETTGTTPGAVLWYSKLFYDVRPKLKAKDWILTNALMPSIDEAYDREMQPRGSDKIIVQGRLDPSLRLFAYLGGPILLDYMAFNAPVDLRVNDYDAAPDALDMYIKTAIRTKAALAMAAAPASSFNLTEMMGLSVRLMEMMKDDGKNKERFLAEAVDEIVKSTTWAVSTRVNIQAEDEEQLNYLHRHGEREAGRLMAPDATGVDIRQRVAEGEIVLRPQLALQSAPGG